jgi:hypothetical protein
VFSAYKHHWSESRKDTILSAWPTSLVQLGSKNEVIARWGSEHARGVWWSALASCGRVHCPFVVLASAWLFGQWLSVGDDGQMWL